MLKAAGLVRYVSAAVRETDFQPRIAFQHAAEHQTGASNRGLERKPHLFFK